MYLFLNSKAKMASTDWTKDWINSLLRVRLWFTIQLSTLYHVSYDKETFDTFMKELPIFLSSYQNFLFDNDNVLLLTKTLGTLRNSIIIYVSYVASKQKDA